MTNHPLDTQTRFDHEDAALDAALEESFPASDPIAISFPKAVDLAPKRIVTRPWRIVVRPGSPKLRRKWGFP